VHNNNGIIFADKDDLGQSLKIPLLLFGCISV